MFYKADSCYELITNYISLAELGQRWDGISVDGIMLDFSCIENLVMNNQLIAYIIISYIFKNGKKTPKAQRVRNLKDGDLPFSSPPYILDFQSVLAFEADNRIKPNLVDAFGSLIIERELPVRNIHGNQFSSIQENNIEVSNFINLLTEKDKSIAELQEIIESLQKENEVLKEKLAEYENRPICELPGLLKYIIGKRDEGLADKAIAQELREKQGLPRNAIGAVLCPKPDPIKDYGQWLDDNILEKRKKQ